MGFETNNIDQGVLLLLQKKLKALESKVDALPTGGGIDFDDIYPVGSIYMSINSTDPGTLFGGTWARIEDRFLLAAGSDYAAGNTGGEATHTLTEAELPRITGSLNFRSDVNPGSFRPTGAFSEAAGGYNSLSVATSSTAAEKKAVLDFGSGQAHNNMPPYLAAYVWKRTA